MRRHARGSSFANVLVEPVTITSETLAPAQHLLANDYHPEKKVPSSLEGLLAHAKRAFIAGDQAACLTSLSRAAPKGKIIQAWLAALELECATAALAQPEKAPEKKPPAKSRSKKAVERSGRETGGH